MIDPAIFVKRLADVVVMPPGGPLICAAIGLVLMSWWPRAGRAIAAFGVVVGLALSTSAVGDWLSSRVEGDLVGLPPAKLAEAMRGSDPPGAVVVLSGGSDYDAREVPGPDILLSRSLFRVVHGARVARASGLPVLVSGGAVVMDRAPEAQVMARIFREDFSITPRWVESGSLDTAENAINSARVLTDAGIRSIVLVTDAMHMRRSQQLFERAGLKVLPAPTGFSGAAGGDRTFAWLPSATGSTRVWAAMHEVVGSWWYGLRNAGPTPGPMDAVAQPRGSGDAAAVSESARALD